MYAELTERSAARVSVSGCGVVKRGDSGDIAVCGVTCETLARASPQLEYKIITNVIK